MKDLLCNTHSQLLRTSLGRPVERLTESRWTSGQRLDEDGFAARHDAVAKLLTEAGVEVDGPGVREAIEQMVTEGPYDWHEGVQLDVLWYGDVADAVPSTRSDNDPEAGKEKVLEFAKPQVLLIDKWNGSGYDTVLPAPLKRALAKPAEDDAEAPQTGRAYLDDSGDGYSWHDVCGLVKEAYGGDGAPKATWAKFLVEVLPAGAHTAEHRAGRPLSNLSDEC